MLSSRALLFIIDPVKMELVLVNRRDCAIGKNTWNAIVCPTLVDQSTHLNHSIVSELFALTQTIYSAPDWMCLGCVTYPMQKSTHLVPCKTNDILNDHAASDNMISFEAKAEEKLDILISFATDLSFASDVFNVDSRVKTFSQEEIEAMHLENGSLAVNVKPIIDQIFSIIRECHPITEDDVLLKQQ